MTESNKKPDLHVTGSSEHIQSQIDDLRTELLALKKWQWFIMGACAAGGALITIALQAFQLVLK